MKKIAVIMGSDSDLPVVGKAIDTVKSFGVECEAHVHLAGAIAASTTLPVIGIPVRGGMLDGLDALLSTVQMPPGIPVATVGVDGAVNAGLLAVEILAVSEPELKEKLKAKRAADKAKVLAKDAALEEKLAAMRG